MCKDKVEEVLTILNLNITHSSTSLIIDKRESNINLCFWHGSLYAFINRHLIGKWKTFLEELSGEKEEGEGKASLKTFHVCMA